MAGRMALIVAISGHYTVFIRTGGDYYPPVRAAREVHSERPNSLANCRLSGLTFAARDG